MWRRKRRERPAPRECWVVLLDGDGREVSARMPVVVNCDPHDFRVSHNFAAFDVVVGHVRWVRVIDADGVSRDVELSPEPV